MKVEALLTAEQVRDLDMLAKREQTSRAKIIRDSAREYIQRNI